MVGTDSVAEAAPDGYTFGVSVVGPLVDNKHPCKKLPCDRAGLTASFGEMTPVSRASTQARQWRCGKLELGTCPASGARRHARWFPRLGMPRAVASASLIK